MKTFVGVVGKNGKFADEGVLSAFKSASQQLPKEGFKGIDGLVEPLFDPDSLVRHLEANTYHSRAVHTKAQDVAGQGWTLNPKMDSPSEAERELIVDLFDNVMEDDISDVLEQAMVDRESVGWLAIEMAREDKDPTGPVVLLRAIPSHTVRAHQDMTRFVQRRGTRKVWFKRAGWTEKDVHKDDGTVHDAGTLDPENRANEVIWDRMYTSRSDVYGIPDHIPAIGAILGDVSRQEFNIAFFQNFGVPAYAVFISGDYDPGDMTNSQGVVYDEDNEDHDPADFKTDLHRQIEAHVDELAENPHSVLVLGVPSAEDGGNVKIEFEKLAVEVRDASFRLYRMDNLKEVLSAHAVPPYRAGIAEQGSLGGSVAEQTDKIYRDSVVAPRQQTLARLINKYVLASYDITTWSFELVDIDLEDEQKELDIATTLFEHGAMTPNDLIRVFGDKYGLEPVDHPAMDSHYIAGTPIDSILPGDVEFALSSVRDSLIEIARKHVQDGSRDGSSGAEVLALLASMQTGPGSTVETGVTAQRRARASAVKSRNGDHSRAAKGRSGPARVSTSSYRPAASRGAGG